MGFGITQACGLPSFVDGDMLLVDEPEFAFSAESRVFV